MKAKIFFAAILATAMGMMFSSCQENNPEGEVTPVSDEAVISALTKQWVSNDDVSDEEATIGITWKKTLFDINTTTKIISLGQMNSYYAKMIPMMGAEDFNGETDFMPTDDLTINEITVKSATEGTIKCTSTATNLETTYEFSALTEKTVVITDEDGNAYKCEAATTTMRFYDISGTN